MARTTVKATYSLDLETTRALEQMARRWNVSKSEALRRAIRSASGCELPSADDREQALDRAQKSLRLTRDAARRWQTRVRAERRAASSGREKRTR
jgi:hypothetical protein